MEMLPTSSKELSETYEKQLLRRPNLGIWIGSGLAAAVCLFLLLTPSTSSLHYSNITGNGQLFSPRRVDEIRRRIDESELNWSKNVKLRDEFFNDKGGVDRLHKLGEGGGTYSIWDIYTPSYPCPLFDERLGRLGDGGKWICGIESLAAYTPKALPAQKGLGAVIYSIGVERESSFEAEVLDRFPAVEIYGYDLSVDHWGPQIMADAKYYKHAHFFKAGISAQDELNKSPPNYSLKSMMKRNGHDFIDIFKIDVEGGEWEVLKAIVDDFPEGLPFGQMQIEVHVNKDSSTVATFDRWWKMLEQAGLRAFHFELNMPTTPGSGMYYAEYCFINVKSNRSPLLGHPVAL